jgi:hypothetical protein
MESKRNTPNLPGTIALACLLLLLSACYDRQDNGSAGTNSGNLTGVDDIAGNSGGNTQVPPADTDGNATDPEPDDTASADPDPVVIALSWQPNPGAIDGYIVHTGPTPETATSVITITPASTISYGAFTDLGLGAGDQACFRIKAYNSYGQSDFSDAVCYIINA